MSVTAVTLRQELGNRMGEMVVSTPTSTGTTTTLVDTKLTQWFSSNTLGAGVEHFVPWVYGTSTADTSNRQVERRAMSWDGVSTLTFWQGDPWPTAITTGSYEVHLRFPASRKLEAINECVGQLSLLWFREFVDTSITTQPQTWSYTLPSGMYVSKVWQVQYQVNTASTNIGFPYADAVGLDWDLYEGTDASGNFTQSLQFGVLPPPGRTLRIRGEAYFPDLVNDTDVLAISGKWQRPTMSWIYAYAACLLNLWQGDMQPAGEVDKYNARQQQLLQEGERLKIEMMHTHKPGRIVVPGRGQGMLNYPSPLASPAWLGGLHIGNS